MIETTVHGRVNVIGEHTDYNGGFVFPTLIPQQTRVRLEKGEDAWVDVHSTQLGRFRYRLGEEQRGPHWADYVQGVTALLRRAGLQLVGCRIAIDSSIPTGSGLSSSAALDVALLRAFRESLQFAMSDLDIARFAQKVENEFVGAHVGIMDPLVCALGKMNHALFVDTRTLGFRQVSIPESCELIVIHSGVTHALSAQGGYNTRRRECDESAHALGLSCLSDLTVRDLDRVRATANDLYYRRVRHVVTENQRVVELLSAFEKSNLVRAGELMNESHASMRDDYEVSIPEMDALVAIAQATPHILGARMTGGGFGGSMVALTQKGKGHECGEQIVDRAVNEIGLKPTLLVPTPQIRNCP